MTYQKIGAAVKTLSGSVTCFGETKSLTWSDTNNCYLTGAFVCKKGDIYAASYTIGGSDGYEEKTGTRNVLLEKATLAASDFTWTPPTDLVYDGSTKTARVSFNGDDTLIGEVTVKYYLNSTPVSEAKEAGTYIVKIDVAESDCYKAVDELTAGSWSFTIVKPAATAEDEPTANNLTYNTEDQVLIAAGSTTSGTMKYSLDAGEEKTWHTNISDITGKTTKAYTVYWMIEGDAGHTDSVVRTLSVTIRAKALSDNDVSAEPIAEQIYSGGSLTPDVTVKHGETTLKKDTDYRVAYENHTDVGTAAVKITGMGNYAGELPTTFEIKPKRLTSLDFSGITVTKVYDGGTSAGTLAGTIAFSGRCGSDDVSITAAPGEYAAGDTDAGANKNVVLTLSLSGSAAANYVLESTTYVFTRAEITKADGSVTAGTGKSGLVYTGAAQELLETAAVSATGEVRYSLDDITYHTALPTAINKGTYTVYCKSFGDKNHRDVEADPAQVSIAAKPITVAAIDKTVYLGSQLPDLSSPELGKDYTVSGLIGKDQLTKIPTLTTDADTHTIDKYTIVISDAYAGDNYTITYQQGKLTVSDWPVIPSTGSTTTTTDRDGNVTETTKDANGVTGTTVTDKNGNVTDISASIPASAVKDGETVTIPVDGVKPADSENAVEITVDVPSGGATVEIPVENPTAGTVVVIVNPDGTETVISGTKLTENGVKVTLTEDATIKVIDNSKTFSDVKAEDYFSDAVKWASARNITGGVDENHFGPEESCTRAQLVTFLWRAAGCPVVDYAMDFTDLGDDYYTEAVRWAASLGIVGGYGNGLFGPDDTVTREQVAAILYRFAVVMGGNVSVGGDTNILGYSDAFAVSPYAISAFHWATGAGIVKGADGKLMPQDPCTRAQIVTMLYRLLGE